MMRSFAAVLLLSLAAGAQETAPADREGVAFFEQKIRPVLVAKCYSCHSADAKKVKGELLLDTREGTLKGGENGPSVVPGDLEKSLLIKAVRWADDDFKMPPKTKLPADVIADFEAWVKRGAPDPRSGAAASVKKAIDLDQARQYWAYRPLQVPEGKQSIDAFLLAKMRAAGVRPNPSADPRRLARRAAFALTGLPPAPEDVDRLVADPSGFPAYVDRLLADPAFGERQARPWLDVARFAESHGFEQDYDRENAWHYRDFLIKAFNDDMPYDRFVQWQVAGDELAPADPLAWMATGFLGAGAFPTQLTETEFESARYDELDSMSATTASAFLATSVGCARCHDHKFDPISAKDYYRLTSAFTTTIRSMAEFLMDPAGDAAALAAWEKDHAGLSAALATFEREELPRRFEAWAAGRPWEKAAAPVWILLEGIEAKSKGGATFTPQKDGSLLATGKNPPNDTWTFTVRNSIAGIRAVKLEALHDASLPHKGPGRAPNGNFALGNFSLTVRPAAKMKLSAGKFSHQQNATTLSAASSVDGDPKTSGWAVDPQFGKDHAVVFELAEPAPAGDLVFEFEFGVNTQHAIGRPRLSVSTHASPPLDGAAGSQALSALLETLRAGGKADAAAYRPLDAEWQKLDRAVREHAAKKPAPKATKVLVTTDGLKPLKHHADDRGFPHFYKETHILARGDVSKKQGVATPGFLPMLTKAGVEEIRWAAPPAESKTPGRRAALARWLTDVDSGAGALTARVIVNRLWALHFGRGIVATPNDFGVQGEKPSHPELLEWLASELIRGGWKLKPIHRLILTSAAFQASSAMSADAAKLDPENKLLWRRDPRRLEAEAIRDSLLHTGGLLDRRMYGPGTLDEAMPRRAVYFFQKRSRLIPMMMIFDAPEPLASQGGRPTTTIAPQALLFMNSPLARRSAAGLAKAAPTPEAAYRRALGRVPTEAEAAKAAAFLKSQAASYKAGGHADPEGAARTDFCHALLCLNEFVYLD